MRLRSGPLFTVTTSTPHTLSIGNACGVGKGHNFRTAEKPPVDKFPALTPHKSYHRSTTSSADEFSAGGSSPPGGELSKFRIPFPRESPIRPASTLVIHNNFLSHRTVSAGEVHAGTQRLILFSPAAEPRGRALPMCQTRTEVEPSFFICLSPTLRRSYKQITRRSLCEGGLP